MARLRKTIGIQRAPRREPTGESPYGKTGKIFGKIGWTSLWSWLEKYF